MTLPKFLIILSVILFSLISIAALFKEGKQSKPIESQPILNEPIVIDLSDPIFKAPPEQREEKKSTEKIIKNQEVPLETTPEIDRIEELFNKEEPKLPIVETIVYKSRVPWQKGRPAWLSDYASHYKTSRHFIARSLNGKPDYLNQELKEGDRFNILRSDKNYEFYLLIDLNKCKLWFYYIDKDLNKRVLLKTYCVGLGRPDANKQSGFLTPLGKYLLGDRTAVYRPKMMGTHKGEKTELMRVFGTRWIPFEKEIGPTTAPAKGFGIHGVPWIEKEGNKLVENAESIGKYESDGCVRLKTNDMEEIFAIVITKPTYIEIVKDFREAKLPGKE